MLLPSLIRRRNRYWLMPLFMVLFNGAYGFANRCHLFPPRRLPLTAIDQAVPLLPWTVLVYLTDMPLVIVSYLLLAKDRTRGRQLWSFLMIFAVCIPLFVLVPTAYPREAWPVPADTHPAIVSILRALRAADEPTNACPSLHVACCYAASFAFLSRGESRRRFGFLSIWATAIAVSTLTTKQHYLLDVIVGIALSCASAALAARYVKEGPSDPSPQSVMG